MALITINERGYAKKRLHYRHVSGVGEKGAYDFLSMSLSKDDISKMNDELVANPALKGYDVTLEQDNESAMDDVAKLVQEAIASKDMSKLNAFVAGRNQRRERIQTFRSKNKLAPPAVVGSQAPAVVPTGKTEEKKDAKKDDKSGKAY